MLSRCEVLHQNMSHFSENEIFSSYFRAQNQVSNNAKIIQISSVEPEIWWLQVIYNENIEIEKIAFIAHSRKSLTMHSHMVASVVKLGFWKIKLINLKIEFNTFYICKTLTFANLNCNFCSSSTTRVY